MLPVQAHADTNDFMELGNSTVKIISYDEMISEISKSKSISIDLARRLIPDIQSSYLNESTERLAYSTYYANIYSEFTVTSEYKPSAYFYCFIEQNGSTRSIVRLLNANIDRYYNGISKQFGGNLYYNLETPQRIYYNVNGDWFNNGTTSSTVGSSIGIGGFASINFSVSNSSNHYVYKNVNGYASIR